MKKHLRRYRRLRKKLLIVSRKLINLFTKGAKPKITHGNKVYLIKSGKEAFRLLIKHIRESKETIDLEYYIFKDDKHGKAIARRLIRKVREGVSVRIIYDYFGSIDTRDDFFLKLKLNGIKVVPFNPIKLFSNPLVWDRRDHKKIAVFDGTTAFVSGWNIGSEYFHDSDNSMKDAGVVLEGPCVRALQKSFNETFAKQSKSKSFAKKQIQYPPLGDDEVWVIESGPSLTFRPMYNAYRLAIMAAKKMVWIENAYFVPPWRLRKALVNAVKRHVDVRIILPDKIDVPLVKYASHNYFKSLLSAGISIFERSKIILHSKIACVDDIWVTIGSTNLHRRSFEKNYELNIVVISERFGKEVKNFISKDLHLSKKINLNDWIQRPFTEKLKEKIAAVFSVFL